MTTAGDTAREAEGTSRPRSVWRDIRLVLTTAGITSLVWIVVGVFAGVNLLDRDSAHTGVAAAPAVADPAPATDAADVAMQMPVQPVPTADGRLLVPVAGVARDALVDSYTDARGDRLHEALDIMAPTGTPVLAAAPGDVEKLFLSDAGGKTIYVRSPDGARMYYYAHLDAYEPGIGEGDFVEAGRKLGTVGASGNADPAAPHLHFAVLTMAPGEPWWEGTPQNPYPLLTTPPPR